MQPTMQHLATWLCALMLLCTACTACDVKSHTASSDSHHQHQQQQGLSAQHAPSRKLLLSQTGTSSWEYHPDAPGAAAAFGSLLGETDGVAAVATAAGRSKSKLHRKNTAALGLTEADFQAMEAEEAAAKKKRDAEADKFSVVRFLGIKSAEEVAAEQKDEGLNWLFKQQIKAKPKAKPYYYDASHKARRKSGQ